MVVALLKFLGCAVVGLIVILGSYDFLMHFVGYKLSILAIKRYLSSRGRGNFPEENDKIILLDAAARSLWAVFYAIVAGLIGLVLLKTLPLRLGIIVAAFAFGYFMRLGELGVIIHIARLKSIAANRQFAYFCDISSGKEFEDECYGIEDILCLDKKYIVADYGTFSFYKLVDECELGGE